MNFASEWIAAFQQMVTNAFSFTAVKVFLAAGIAALFAILDIAHPSARIVVHLMVLDLILGLALAIWHRSWSLKKVKEGGAKIIGYGIGLYICHLVDTGCNLNGLFWNFSGALCVWLIAGEAESCFRHVRTFAPHVAPEWVLEKLKKLKDGLEKDQK